MDRTDQNWIYFPLERANSAAQRTESGESPLVGGSQFLHAAIISFFFKKKKVAGLDATVVDLALTAHGRSTYDAVVTGILYACTCLAQESARASLGSIDSGHGGCYESGAT